MRISRQLPKANNVIDYNLQNNVEYFNYLGSMMTNYARCAREIKSRIAMIKVTFTSFRPQIGLKYKEETHKKLLLKKLYVVLKLRHFGNAL